MSVLAQGIVRIGTRDAPLSFGAAGSPTDSLTFTHNLNKFPLEILVTDLDLNPLNAGGFFTTTVTSNTIEISNLVISAQDVLVRVTFEDLSLQSAGVVLSDDSRLVFS